MAKHRAVLTAWTRTAHFLLEKKTMNEAFFWGGGNEGGVKTRILFSEDQDGPRGFRLWRWGQPASGAGDRAVLRPGVPSLLTCRAHPLSALLCWEMEPAERKL